MKLLKLLGSFLNGWLMVIVMIVALACFNLGLIPSADKNVEREREIAVEQQAQSASVVSDLVQELTQMGDTIVGNTLAQMVVVLLIGIASGVALRPRVDEWQQTRSVQAARRRADQHAADLRLLAADDAKDNKPGPAKSNIKTVKYQR